MYKKSSSDHQSRRGSQQSRTAEEFLSKDVADVPVTWFQVCHKQVTLAFSERSRGQNFPDHPYLVVSFLLHVHAVHRHHPVPGAQPRRFCGGPGLHFADELAALPFLAMQVKSIPAVPFCHEAEPRFALAGHFLAPFKTPRVMEIRLNVFFSFPLLQHGSQSSGWRGERHILPACCARIANSKKLQALKSKMRKRKHKFSTTCGSGAEAENRCLQIECPEQG